MKTGSFKKTNKIDKHVARVVKKKKEREMTQTTKLRNEKGTIKSYRNKQD